MPEPIDVEKEIGRKTRRAFLTGGAAAVVGLGAWEFIRSSSREDGTLWPLRRALQANETVARAYFGRTRTAEEYSSDRAAEPKANGDLGLDEDFDVAKWKLILEAPGGTQQLDLNAVRSLPRVAMTTELRCIEGWSQVVSWAGARFSDFVGRFAPDARSAGYASLETPDKEYFVGLEMAAALHPQTLLAYEMNGQPLNDDHGAPLRLVIPVKYGIKNIKRIGRISFAGERPADYWAKVGYDWYAGL
jgi:DMSO/TMAO reductase YedYZ molybdopterin-dependent catalytic subunit